MTLFTFKRWSITNTFPDRILSDEQKTKIRELYADFNKQKYPREKRREALEKLTADICLLLTAEQQTIYKQMIEQSIADMKKGKRGQSKE